MVVYNRNKCKVRGLPYPGNYERVEYLQSTSADTETYIDTNYILKAHDMVEFTYKNDDNFPEFSWRALFGSRNRVYTSKSFGLFSNNGNPGNNGYCYFRTGNELPTNIKYDGKCKIICKDSTISFVYEDSIKNFTNTGNIEDTQSTCFIFNLNRGVGIGGKDPDNWGCVGKLYYFKIFDSNNTLVRSFIPVIRKSDKKPGMFDLVEQKFYTNQGTGEFLTGPIMR